MDSMENHIDLRLLLKYRNVSTPITKNAAESHSRVVSGSIGAILVASCMSFMSGYPLTEITEPPLVLIGWSENLSERRNLGFTPFIDLVSKVLRTSSPPITRHPFLSVNDFTRYHLGPMLRYFTVVSASTRGDTKLYRRLPNRWTTSLWLISSLSREN